MSPNDLKKLASMRRMIVQPQALNGPPINITIDLSALTSALAKLPTKDDELHVVDRVVPSPG